MDLTFATFPFQAGVNKLADLAGVTLGPNGRNSVLESKYDSPKIANDGVTVAKGVKIVAADANLTRSIERTAEALVSELKSMSKEVEDSELAHIAAVTAENNYEVGNKIAKAE